MRILRILTGTRLISKLASYLLRNRSGCSELCSGYAYGNSSVFKFDFSENSQRPHRTMNWNSVHRFNFIYSVPVFIRGNFLLCARPYSNEHIRTYSHELYLVLLYIRNITVYVFSRRVYKVPSSIQCGEVSS